MSTKWQLFCLNMLNLDVLKLGFIAIILCVKSYTFSQTFLSENVPQFLLMTDSSMLVQVMAWCWLGNEQLPDWVMTKTNDSVCWQCH